MSMYSDTISNDPLKGIELKGGQQLSVVMTRIHQGIPMREDVTILAVEGDAVLLATRNSLALVDMVGAIHLHSTEFPQTIRGRMLRRDLRKGTFLLGDLSYVPKNWKERSQVRVQPRTPIFFNIHKRLRYIRAGLLDLDIGGVGATAERSALGLLQEDDPHSVHLGLKLEPNLEISSIRGTICYKLDINQNLVRLGISLQPTSKQADQLARYVDQRRAEILQDLAEAYQHAVMPAPVESLYF
jgi:hypothetical protein